MGEVRNLTLPALTKFQRKCSGSRQGSFVPATASPGLDCEIPEINPAPDDATWVARVRAGDEESARALVQRLYPTVIKSIRCHLPRRASEEDLVQVVFAKIFHKLDQYSGLAPLEHWVSRITINTCLSQLKHEAVRPEWCMGELSEEEQAVVQQLASTRDELPDECSHDARELLDKLLSCLKPEERLIITMLHLEEKSTKEISRATGWSISRVKVAAFRARNKMRKAWSVLMKSERNELASAGYQV
jgi:RNA polymerase sigma-70 factor, ECF subfamily